MAVNPGQISLNPHYGKPIGGPWTSGSSSPWNPVGPMNSPRQQSPTPTSNTLGSEAVRATGGGPFDQSYRQNLASYAGGLAQRPGGSLSFDPTGQLFGAPTGGGNAPVSGSPTDLLSAALGGQAYSAQTQLPTAPQNTMMNPSDSYWRRWIQAFNNQGQMQRGRYQEY